MKDSEMGGTCGTHGGGEKGVDWKMILKLFLEK
jgi:hypothetical protein